MAFTSWKWAFLAETILMIAPVSILFLMIPGQYYLTDRSGMLVPHNGPNDSDDAALIDSDLQVEDKRQKKYTKDAIS